MQLTCKRLETIGTKHTHSRLLGKIRGVKRQLNSDWRNDAGNEKNGPPPRQIQIPFRGEGYRFGKVFTKVSRHQFKDSDGL